MSETDNAERFLLQAIAKARENIAAGGRPFASVLVKDGETVLTVGNEMHLYPDPTAHSEMVAIRRACAELNTPMLEGYEIYASGHPCPMCLAAMRTAGITTVYYAHSNEDSEAYGFSSAESYEDLHKPFAEQSMRIRFLRARQAGLPELYDEWQEAAAR